MRRVKKPVAGVVLETRDGYLLFGRSTIFGGSLIIPGGGIKDGETPHEAAVREIKEETGLDVSGYPAKLIANHRTAKTHKTLASGETVELDLELHDFHIVLDDRNKDSIALTAEDDFKEPVWVHKTEVDAGAISPPTVWLLQELGYLDKL